MAFDLDQIIAEQEPPADRRKKFEFTFDGHKYVLPNEVDMLALRAVNENELVTALRKVLSDDDYARIQKSAKTMTQRSLWALFDAYYDHIIGLAAGKSPASPPRSQPTARPSKRTSRTNTRGRGSRK